MSWLPPSYVLLKNYGKQGPLRPDHFWLKFALGVAGFFLLLLAILAGNTRVWG